MTTKKLYESEALLDRARAARAIKHYPAAQQLYTAALDSRTEALGKDVSVAQIMDEFGTLCVELGEFGIAEQLFNDAAAMIESIFYAGHATLAPMLEHLADMYIKQGKYAEAEPIATRALEVNDKTLTGEHRTTLQSVYRLAEVQRKLGKFADAEKTLTKALKHVDTPLGPLEEFKYNLALLFEDQGKAPEADKAYQEAIEGFEYRRTLPRLAQCLDSYAAFLKKNNRADEAGKASLRAEKMREISKDWNHSQDMFPSTLLRA